MRFIELLIAVTATALVAVNAAPTGMNNVVAVPQDTNNMIFDPKNMKRESGRRRQQMNKFQKRHKPCCGGMLGLGFDAKARLDFGANAQTNVDAPIAANAVAPPVVIAPQVAAPINAAAAPPAPEAPKPGDTINVRVENNHVN